MKTLIIHPKDPTTDFLSVIYEDMNCSIIRNSLSTSLLKNTIKDHDRVIFLGHGTEYGLLGFDRIFIGSDLVYLLREKEENVYIWCHANKFVEKYKLKGFTTGMIISEWGEAELLLDELDYVATPTWMIERDIQSSNNLFSTCVRNNIKFKKSEMLRKMINNYTVDDKNPIIDYNMKNLFCF